MAQESTSPKNAAADYDAVLAQMAKLRDDIAQIAHSVQSIASARGHDLGKDITDGLDFSARYLGRKGHEADVRVEDAVAANPYIALGLAAGLGLLLGVITRR
jgi:ElaB/YqjD/DUF883 family membrane-anchored ribosome-binding protein